MRAIERVTRYFKYIGTHIFAAMYGKHIKKYEEEVEKNSNDSESMTQYDYKVVH